jgi:hypothetical protein
MTGSDNLTGATDEALVAELEARAEKLPTGLKTRLSAVLAERTRPRVEGALAGADEKAAENPRLAVYREQYDSLPETEKSLCAWETLVQRLSGGKLKKAEVMQGGGQLFGIDAEGRALFKDKGVEPVMYGFDQEGKLLQIYDRDPGQMKKVKKWANYFEIRKQARADGYELFADGGNLFADDGNYGFGDEMKQAQDYTKEPFVASEGRKEWRASWLESGDKPGDARRADFHPVGGRVVVDDRNPERRFDNYGAVRLLRV